MLGIILLNFKSFEDVKKCIDSIYLTVNKIDYRIYIVDNNSPDNSYLNLKREYGNKNNIKVLQSGKNGGYSYGNNVGIRKALEDSCDAILISNTDIIYYENSINSMYKKLFQLNDIAIIGPDMINSQGEYSQINIPTPSLNNYWKSKKPFSYLINDSQKKQKYNTDYIFQGMVQGSSFMIKTDIVRKVGRLDENVFLFGEEQILAYKMRELGYKTQIDHDALIMHEHSATISKEGLAFERFHMYYSTSYVLRKYLKISNVNLTLIIIYNILSYSLQSIYNSSYRKYFFLFAKKMFSLYSI